jgi:hypothetical protein
MEQPRLEALHPHPNRQSCGHNEPDCKPDAPHPGNNDEERSQELEVENRNDGIIDYVPGRR